MKNRKIDDHNSLVFVSAYETQALIHWKTKLRSTRGRRRSTTTRSGAYQLSNAFIIAFELTYISPGEIKHDTDNLYNNTICIYIVYKVFNNNLKGGRHASTSLGSPYRGPVTTGKPGIHLAPSRFGFSQSPLPALCRQDTSCAWRPRLRSRFPDWRLR